MKCFIFSSFGPIGHKLYTVDTYFDDSIGWNAKDLSTGASYTRAFYAAYTGNGNYIVDFDGKVTLVINLTKN